jgi:hypothetical protein
MKDVTTTVAELRAWASHIMEQARLLPHPTADADAKLLNDAATAIEERDVRIAELEAEVAALRRSTKN